MNPVTDTHTCNKIIDKMNTGSCIGGNKHKKNKKN